MRRLAAEWPDEEIAKQVVSQLSWGHNVRLLQKVKDPAERIWYERQTFEQGWSRSALEMQVDSGLYRREGAAVTNFKRTLPHPDSDLAQQTLKDPYNFEFLTVAGPARE